MSRLVTWPRRAEADATIRRFEPAYWTVDFPLPMMASVITTGPDALRVRAVFRTNRDLAGLIWHTEDRADHGLFAYHRARDCRGCVLEFDWFSSGIRPMDRLQSVSLTVETYRNGTHYVRLWNYATSGTPDACHIRMVLDETTRGGFYADAPVPWHDVKRLFISLQPLAAGRGDCALAAPAAPGTSTITLNVGDGGPIAPGARVYILGSHPDVPAYTVTSATSGPVQVVSGPIGRQRVHFEAPPADRLENETSRFLDWLNGTSNEPPLLKAGLGHLWFVTLHPFDDGNGRIARAIGDLLLARADGSPQRFYSLSAQIQRERNAYYDILERTQKNLPGANFRGSPEGGRHRDVPDNRSMDVTEWLAWFLDTLHRAVDQAQHTLDAVLTKARFWQRWATTPLNERQVKLLNKLLDGFEGKLTSSKWAAIAKCSPDTALRDINDLLMRGVLRKSNAGGRSTSYELNELPE